MAANKAPVDFGESDTSASAPSLYFGEVDPSSTSVVTVRHTADRLAAEIRSTNADTYLRIAMAVVISLIFIGLNAAVIYIINGAMTVDNAMISLAPNHAPHRLVTEKVLMALIAGTVAQTGIAILAIMSYLFPKERGKQGPAKPTKSKPLSG